MSRSGAMLHSDDSLAFSSPSRVKAPPSSGKLVSNKPFLEVGVSASMVTHKTYGVVAEESARTGSEAGDMSND